MTELGSIIGRLTTKRDQMDVALAALRGIENEEPIARRGRPPGAKNKEAVAVVVKKARRKMSKAGRSRIAAASKARWAKWREERGG